MKRTHLVLLPLLTIAFAVLCSAQATTGNNSISGFVFAGRNSPLSEASVELLDEYGRLAARVRTDASGRFNFTRLPAGRYTVRANAQQYGMEEAMQEVEISQRITPGT